MPDLDRLDRVLEEFPDAAGEGRGRKRGLFGRRSRSEEAFWDGEPDARGDDLDPPPGRGRAGRRGRADDAGPRDRDRPAGPRDRDRPAGPRDRDRPAGPGEHPGRGAHTGSRSARPAGPADAEPTLPPRRSRGRDGAPPLSRDPRAQPGGAGSTAGPRRPQGEPDPAAAHTGPLTGRRGDLGRPAAPGGPGPMVRPAELGGDGPRDDPGDSHQRLRGRRHRAQADPAPDGAVPERAAAPWAGEPVGSRRRPVAPGAAAPAHGGPRLRYKTTVEMGPGPGTSPGTGPLGSIRTYQPGTGPQVAVDDSASSWAGTGPGPAVETGPRRVSAGQLTTAPDTDGRGRKRRSASAAEAQPPSGRDAAAARTGRGRTAERADRDAAPAGTGRGWTAERAARSADPARVRSAGPAQARPAEPARAGRRSGQRRSRRMIMVAVAGVAAVVVAAGAADVLGLFGGNGPAHVLVAPDRLGAYVRRPQLEKQGNLAALQRQVIAKSAGQASHVVSGVYEDSAGSSPQMILFVGGNLSGVSASDFISSFAQQSKGSFMTSPGTLGGSAACVNAQASVPGSVALCTWADNDTFGVVASLTMNATKLAAEMRVMRPMVERIAS